MYAIVIGGGNVGYGIATELQRLPDYEVTIVERDSDRASNLRAHLGEMLVFGDRSAVPRLQPVGPHPADPLLPPSAAPTPHPLPSPAPTPRPNAAAPPRRSHANHPCGRHSFAFGQAWGNPRLPNPEGRHHRLCRPYRGKRCRLSPEEEGTESANALKTGCFAANTRRAYTLPKALACRNRRRAPRRTHRRFLDRRLLPHPQ